jgi:hypothetical protein
LRGDRNPDFEEYLSKEYEKAEQTGNYGRMEMLESALLHDTPTDFRNKSVDTDYDEDYRRMASDFAEEMESFRDSKGDKVNFGKMYEVEIQTPADTFLDEGKPLSKQSDFVKKALESEGFPDDTIGYDIYDKIAGSSEDDLFKEEKGIKKFLEKGIKGLKYSDPESPAPKKAFNFVIFDDALLDIKRKYKQGGSVYNQGIGTLARKLQQGGEAKPVYEYGYTPTETTIDPLSRYSKGLLGFGRTIIEPFIPVKRERLQEEETIKIPVIKPSNAQSVLDFISKETGKSLLESGMTKEDFFYSPRKGEQDIDFASGRELLPKDYRFVFDTEGNPNEGYIEIKTPPVFGKAEISVSNMPLVQFGKKTGQYIQDILTPETRTEALKKGASTVGAVGKALAEIPAQQMRGAQALSQGFDAYMDKEGNISSFDPLLVPTLSFGAGTTLKVMGKNIREGGNPNSVTLGTFVGRQASNLTDEQRQSFKNYEKREREIKRKMKAEGYTPAYIEKERLKIDEQLRQETDVFRGVDGQLRLEISDKEAKSRSFDELPEGIELKQFSLKNIPDSKKAIEYLKDESNFIDNPYQRENMFVQLASILQSNWTIGQSPMKSSSIYNQTKDDKDLMSKDIDVLGVKFRYDEIETPENRSGMTYQLYTHKDPNKRFTPIRKDEVSPEDMRLVYQSKERGLSFLRGEFFDALNLETRQYEIGGKKLSTPEFAKKIYEPEAGDKFPRGFGLKAFVFPTLDETGKLDNLIEGLDQKTLEKNAKEYQGKKRITLNLLVDTDEVTLLDTKKIAKEKYKKGVNIDQFLTHDVLFKIYPSLRKTKLVLDEQKGSSLADYDPSTNTITIKNLEEFEKGMQGKGFLLHELMHNIQELEKFGKGGNQRTVQNNVRQELVDAIYSINTDLNQLALLPISPKIFKDSYLTGDYSVGKDIIKPSINRVTIRQFDDADKSDIRLQTLRNEEQSRMWRELSNRENITPRRVTSQQEWYRLGNVVRSEIGPMPQRSGKKQKDWLRKASSIMERLQKDDSNVYSDRKDIFLNLDRLDKKENQTVSYTQGSGADYRRKIKDLIKNVRNEAEGMTDKELAKALREASKKFSETRTLDLERDRLIGQFNEMKYETPSETYKRLAGEVEARLVELRMNFSPEEIKYFTPSSFQKITERYDQQGNLRFYPKKVAGETEFRKKGEGGSDPEDFGMDVPRDEQIVIKRNTGGFISRKPNPFMSGIPMILRNRNNAKI